MISFNNYFFNSTIIVPNTVQNLFSSIVGGWLEKDHLIKMNNSEFEKSFVVYVPDRIEAGYILSYSMMQRIFEFKKREVNVDKR